MSSQPTITVLTGQTALVDFGDRPGSGVGRIEGLVYEDANADGVRQAGEAGLADVRLTDGLDVVATDALGRAVAAEEPSLVPRVVKLERLGPGGQQIAVHVAVLVRHASGDGDGVPIGDEFAGQGKDLTQPESLRQR